ncbi:hypothetical protein OKW30_004678 [Paraburkholderia sp. Clong3]
MSSVPTVPRDEGLRDPIAVNCVLEVKLAFVNQSRNYS